MIRDSIPVITSINPTGGLLRFSTLTRLALFIAPVAWLDCSPQHASGPEASSLSDLFDRIDRNLLYRVISYLGAIGFVASSISTIAHLVKRARLAGIPAGLPGYGQEYLPKRPAAVQLMASLPEVIGLGLLGAVAAIASIPLIIAMFGIPMALVSAFFGKFDLNLLLVGIGAAIMFGLLATLAGAVGRGILRAVVARRRSHGLPVVTNLERLDLAQRQPAPYEIQELVFTLILMVAVAATVYSGHPVWAGIASLALAINLFLAGQKAHHHVRKGWIEGLIRLEREGYGITPDTPKVYVYPEANGDRYPVAFAELAEALYQRRLSPMHRSDVPWPHWDQRLWQGVNSQWINYYRRDTPSADDVGMELAQAVVVLADALGRKPLQGQTNGPAKPLVEWIVTTNPMNQAGQGEAIALDPSSPVSTKQSAALVADRVRRLTP